MRALICVLLFSFRRGQRERDFWLAQQSAVLETRPAAPQTVSPQVHTAEKSCWTDTRSAGLELYSSTFGKNTATLNSLLCGVDYCASICTKTVVNSALTWAAPVITPRCPDFQCTYFPTIQSVLHKLGFVSDIITHLLPQHQAADVHTTTSHSVCLSLRLLGVLPHRLRVEEIFEERLISPHCQRIWHSQLQHNYLIMLNCSKIKVLIWFYYFKKLS